MKSLTYSETVRRIAELIQGAPVDELPTIIGQIEALKAEAFARLMAPRPDAGEIGQDPDDRLLTADEAAEMLGQTSRWVRDHRLELPRVKLPGRTLRFSEKRLAAMIKRRSYG